MRVLSLLSSVAVIAIVLWDAFETVVLPRTVGRRLRLARFYFHLTWRTWSRSAALFRAEGRRERFLAVFGPLSLLGLVGIWALGLIVGFAGLHWSDGSHLSPLGADLPFLDDLYMSGTTFVDAGIG